MVADDPAQYRPPISTMEYVTKMGKALVERPGMELVRAPYPIEHARTRFVRVDYKENYSGGSVSRAFVATERNGYLLSWTFVAGSPQELDQLVDSLDRLWFQTSQKQQK